MKELGLSREDCLTLGGEVKGGCEAIRRRCSPVKQFRVGLMRGRLQIVLPRDGLRLSDNWLPGLRLSCDGLTGWKGWWLV